MMEHTDRMGGTRTCTVYAMTTPVPSAPDGPFMASSDRQYCNKCLEENPDICMCPFAQEVPVDRRMKRIEIQQHTLERSYREAEAIYATCSNPTMDH